MNKKVDYDEMFGYDPRRRSSSAASDSETQYEERCRKEASERENRPETVEKFRNRRKNKEGFFARSEPFSSVSPGLYSMHRHDRVNLFDLLIKYVDGFAVGALLGVLVWLLIPKLIPVTIAATVGFIGGVVLQFRVHDGYSAQDTFREGLPAFIGAVITAVIVIVTFRNV